jgi:hypothetical protein
LNRCLGKLRDFYHGHHQPTLEDSDARLLLEEIDIWLLEQIDGCERWEHILQDMDSCFQFPLDGFQGLVEANNTSSSRIAVIEMLAKDCACPFWMPKNRERIKAHNVTLQGMKLGYCQLLLSSIHTAVAFIPLPILIDPSFDTLSGLDLWGSDLQRLSKACKDCLEFNKSHHGIKEAMQRVTLASVLLFVHSNPFFQASPSLCSTLISHLNMRRNLCGGEHIEYWEGASVPAISMKGSTGVSLAVNCLKHRRNGAIWMPSSPEESKIADVIGLFNYVPSFMNGESEYDIVFIKLYDSLHPDWPVDCTSAIDRTTSNMLIQEWRENKKDYPHQISFKSENNLKVTVTFKFVLLTIDQCLSIPSSGDPVVDEQEGTNNLQTLLPTASYALRHAQWMWKLLHQ